MKALQGKSWMASFVMCLRKSILLGLISVLPPLCAKTSKGSNCLFDNNNGLWCRLCCTVATVISEMESSSLLKEEQRTALRASLNGKHVCTLFPTGFEQKFTKFILLGIMKKCFILYHIRFIVSSE